jgi:hypothetical protein
MEKDYCTQNDSNCATCSLSNYGRDCRNHKIIDGGINDNYRRDADGSLYRAYDTTGNLIAKSQIEPDAELDWSTVKSPKSSKKQTNDNRPCPHCHTYCYGDCQS